MEFYRNYPIYTKDQSRQLVSGIHSNQDAVWNKNIVEFSGTCRPLRSSENGNETNFLSACDDARKSYTKRTSFMISDILSTENKSRNVDNNCSDTTSNGDSDEESNTPASRGCSTSGTYIQIIKHHFFLNTKTVKE